MTQLGFAFVVFALGFRTWWRRLRVGPIRPSWSWLKETIVAGLRYNGQRFLHLSPAAARARLEALALPAARGVVVEPLDLGGLRGASFIARGAKPTRTLLYFHGGGFALGSTAGYRELLARIALTCDVRVLGVDYRLAPEDPFPAAVEDCLAAYRAVLATGVDPAHLHLGGDSSGGALAITTLLEARDRGVPLPAGAVLFSPWVDLTSSHPSVETNAGADWGDRHYLAHWTALYLNGHDARDPRASPLYADLAGLPRLMIQIGTAELLLDEVTAFADKARAAGVDVTLVPCTDMPHGWVMLDQFFPVEARGSLAAVRDWLAS